jgi:hypothetical protein
MRDAPIAVPAGANQRALGAFFTARAMVSQAARRRSATVGDTDEYP